MQHLNSTGARRLAELHNIKHANKELQRGRESACVCEEGMWNSAKPLCTEFSAYSFKTATICRILSFLASPFKWLLRALMTLLEQRWTNAKLFKGPTFTCVQRLPIKFCRWSHLNAITAGILYFQNNFASSGMDILAILPLCTDKISDLLRPRHHKETNQKLNLLIGM